MAKQILVTFAVFLSFSIVPVRAFCTEHPGKEIIDAILGMMTAGDIVKDSRGGTMPTAFGYSFIDECHFKVHSEWYGETHGVIDDEIVPLGEVRTEKLMEGGKYYLFFRCREGSKCVSVKGENTGDPHDYLFVQSIVPAGGDPDISSELKGRFEELSLRCAVRNLD
jgi:hypothetical protein